MVAPSLGVYAPFLGLYEGRKDGGVGPTIDETPRRSSIWNEGHEFGYNGAKVAVVGRNIAPCGSGKGSRQEEYPC